MDASDDIGRTLHAIRHAQAPCNAASRTWSKQRNTGNVNRIDTSPQNTYIVLTLNPQIGDSSPVRSLAVDMSEQALILEVQIGKSMSCTIEAAHERIAGSISDALQSPVLQIQVRAQSDSEIKTQVIIIERIRSFQIIPVRICSLVGICRIIMVVENISHFLGFFLLDPFGIILAVSGGPSISRWFPDGLAADDDRLICLDKPVKPGSRRRGSAVDQIDEFEELLRSIYLEIRLIVARTCS